MYMKINNSNSSNYQIDSPRSYWIASTESQNYPSLNEDITVDIAIIGGGITGITAAYLLKQEGYTVALADAGRILQGTTGHTTAKVTIQHSLIYDRLINNVGEEKAGQYARANEFAIEMIADLVKEKNIDCDFVRRPAFLYTQATQYISGIQKEARAASRLGIKSSYEEKLPLPFEIRAALRFENQAQFHPLKYLLALAKDIPGSGSYIFENTRALDIEENDLCSVITEQGKRIFAKEVIIASHFPFFDGMGLYLTRIYPERSYILGLTMNKAFPDGMFINIEEPTRSLRSQSMDQEELILIGGENHKTGHGTDTHTHYKKLEEFARENFPVKDILYRWSTQDYDTMDGIPYVGHLTAKTPHLYVATGFGKWGMTNGTAAAILLKDMIKKGTSPWEPVYNPSRFQPIASAKNFIKENADVVENLIAGKIRKVPADISIPSGEGKVVNIDGKKTGLYRDDKGELHGVDTTCTHLGCELQWNSAEHSWDCPCHGSRFTIDGDIIDGPALRSLQTIDDKTVE